MQLLDIRFSFICRSTYAIDEGRNPIVLRMLYSEKKDGTSLPACIALEAIGTAIARPTTNVRDTDPGQNRQLPNHSWIN